MALSDIVNVQISLVSPTVTQIGFGTGLILGNPASFGSDVVRVYSNMTGVGADFATSTQEYKDAQAYFSQALIPGQLLIGKRTAKVAQVDTLKILNATPGSFVVTINGVAYTYVAASGTVSNIRDALLSVLQAASLPITFASSSTDSITATANTAGTGFSVGVSANISDTPTTANNGVVEDIKAVQAVNDTWYMLNLVSHTDDDILAAAAYIETQFKMFMAASSSSAILTSSTSDVASILMGKAYKRTALMFSNDLVDGPDSAWTGGCLPYNPGSETWKFKSLVGVTPDNNLTVSQVSYAKGKNVNVYQTNAGVSIMSEGKVVNGQFIDNIRFIDWMSSQIQQQIYARLVSISKIPFTDAGVAIIQSIITTVLKQGQQVGGLSSNPDFLVTAPLVSSVPQAARVARLLPNVTFTATLAGAIHSTQIVGTVSV